MSRPFLKVCGIRRPTDLRYVLERGVRYAGLIVEVPTSLRSLSLPQAVQLAACAPNRIVAVVRDLPEDRLKEIVHRLNPVALQLHGQEPPELVAALHEVFPELQIWRVLTIPPQASHPQTCLEQLRREAQRYAEVGATALVLDTRLPGGSGGTGVCCDWGIAAQLARSVALPVVLAGGLGPDNLAAAARQVAPAGLDVSSGVEQTPGVKSQELLDRLFTAWASIA